MSACSQRKNVIIKPAVEAQEMGLAPGGSCGGYGGSMEGVEDGTHRTKHLSLSSWPVLRPGPGPSC